MGTKTVSADRFLKPPKPGDCYRELLRTILLSTSVRGSGLTIAVGLGNLQVGIAEVARKPEAAR
jgi:hypothetical protein